jgi:hypothetical protein
MPNVYWFSKIHLNAHLNVAFINANANAFVPIPDNYPSEAGALLNGFSA